jgi:carbon storage regulator
VLILARRQGESIMIGSNVSVTVLGIKNGQIRLGISAPKEIPVHREEIFERIQAEGVRQEGHGQPFAGRHR